jgi:hypothetical protein
MATKREAVKACKEARDTVNERLSQLNWQICKEVENLQRLHELENGLKSGVYISDDVVEEAADLAEGELERTF